MFAIILSLAAILLAVASVGLVNVNVLGELFCIISSISVNAALDLDSDVASAATSVSAATLVLVRLIVLITVLELSTE